MRTTVTLFVILDIIGLIPIYLSFLKNSSKRATEKCADKTIVFVIIILFAFLLFGAHILNFFSISIADFKIAGGIILIIVGIKFVLGMRVLPLGKRGLQSFAAVPFATPLLVGPGTITTLIILVDTYGIFIPFIAVLVNILVIWVLLRHARVIFRLLGHQGSEVVTRIMGLFITAIALEFIRTGFLG